MDESNLSTVMKSVKVVCETGKPVASQISWECGSTITFVGIINAAGHYIPPVFIIPRKRWNDKFMRDTIDGSKGILLENGWMNGDCFLKTLEYIKAHNHCSMGNMILFIIDNAECHMDLASVEYAMANGIEMLTLHHIQQRKCNP